MFVLHCYRNTIVLVDTVQLFTALALLVLCYLRLFIDRWAHEAQCVQISTITLDVTTYDRVVLAQAITYRHHILGHKAIKADVDMQQSTVLNECLAPFPSGLRTFKLFKLMSLINRDVILFLWVLRNDDAVVPTGAKRVKGQVEHSNRRIIPDGFGE